MRIDLRLPIAIGLFYLPGLMMLIGAMMLGYTVAEAREVIAIFGGVLGSFWSVIIWTDHIFVPIWWTWRGGE